MLQNYVITGVAWLPSVRAVRRLVYSNQRTKLFYICIMYTAKDILEEGKNDVKSLWP